MTPTEFIDGLLFARHIYTTLKPTAGFPRHVSGFVAQAWFDSNGVMRIQVETRPSVWSVISPDMIESFSFQDSDDAIETEPPTP